MTDNKTFWQDRPTLVTGATGLLGGWLVPRLLECAQMPHHVPQLASFHRQRCPKTWCMKLTEASDPGSILLVSLVPREFALGESMGAKWIHHAHAILSLMQTFGEGFPVDTDRFHADVELLDLVSS